MTIAEMFREEGLQQGLQQGIQKGIQKGMRKGMQKGREEAVIQLVKSLLAEQVDLSVISRVTKLSVAEIQKLNIAN